MLPLQHRLDPQQSLFRPRRAAGPLGIRSWCARWSRIIPAALLAALPAPAAPRSRPAPRPTGRSGPASRSSGVMGLDSTGFEWLTGTPIAPLPHLRPEAGGLEPDPRALGGRLASWRRRRLWRTAPSGRCSFPIPHPAGDRGAPEAALGKCAAGYFNRHYGEYGRGLAHRRLDRLILRIGWEWDADYFRLGRQERPAQARLYGDCFAQVVRSIRRGLPGQSDPLRLELDHGGHPRVCSRRAIPATTTSTS